MEVRIHQKCIKKRCSKSSGKMMQKWNLQKLCARRGHVPGVQEVRSSSRDSRSRFPHACNIITKTNIWQTAENQRPGTFAGRHGADLSIYWAQAPPGPDLLAPRSVALAIVSTTGQAPIFGSNLGFSYFWNYFHIFEANTYFWMIQFFEQTNHIFEANNKTFSETLMFPNETLSWKRNGFE